MKNRYVVYRNTILQTCFSVAIYGIIFSSCNSLGKKNSQAENSSNNASCNITRPSDNTCTSNSFKKTTTTNITKKLNPCKLLHKNGIYDFNECINNPDQDTIKKRIGNKASGLVSIHKVYKNSKNNELLNAEIIQDNKIQTPKYISVTTELTENLFDKLEVNIKEERFKKYNGILERHELFGMGLFGNEELNLNDPIKLSQLRNHIQSLLKELKELKDKKIVFQDRYEKDIMELGELIKKTLESDRALESFSQLRSGKSSKTLKQNLEDKLSLIKGNTSTGKPLIVAIRSSSTFEDSENNAAAGLFKTIINVDAQDINKVLRSTINVISSMWGKAAIAEYIECGCCQNEMSVLIQKQFFTQISGVMFSSDSIDSSKVSLTLGLGKGEDLVDGKQSGMVVTINKVDILNLLQNKKPIDEISVCVEQNFIVDGYDYGHDQYVGYEYVHIHPNGKLKTRKNKVHSCNNNEADLEDFKVNLKYMIRQNLGKTIHGEPSFVKIKGLEKALIQLAVYALLSELNSNSCRDIEFGLNTICIRNKNDSRKYKLDDKSLGHESLDDKSVDDDSFEVKSVILQDRPLFLSKEILLFSNESYSEICDDLQSIDNQTTCITRHCMQEGIVIEDKEYLEKHKNNQLGKKKYIILSSGSVEPFNCYLNKNIAGFIVAQASTKDHMSTECSTKNIPVIRTKKIKLFSDKYKNKKVTIGSVQVGGKMKPLVSSNFSKAISISKAKNINDVAIKDFINRPKDPTQEVLQKEGKVVNKLSSILEKKNQIKDGWIYDKNQNWNFDEKVSEDETCLERYFNVYEYAIELNNHLINSLDNYSINDVINNCPTLLIDKSKIAEFGNQWVSQEIVRQISEFTKKLITFIQISLSLMNLSDKESKQYENSCKNIIDEINRSTSSVSSISIKDEWDLIKYKGNISKLKYSLYNNCMNISRIQEKLETGDKSLTVQEIIAFFHRKIVEIPVRARKRLGLPYTACYLSKRINQSEYLQVKKNIYSNACENYIKNKVYNLWVIFPKVNLVLKGKDNFMMDIAFANHSMQVIQNKDPKDTNNSTDADYLSFRIYQDCMQIGEQCENIESKMKAIASKHDISLSFDQNIRKLSSGNEYVMSWKFSHLNFEPDKIVKLHEDLVNSFDKIFY